MASVKPRGGRFELTVKRKRIREKPWYFTFDSEAEALEYGNKLEALLDAGIVPPELVDDVKRYETIGDVIREYLVQRHVSDSDKNNLYSLLTKVGKVSVKTVNFKWAESWVTEFKCVHNSAPSTIRHNVGALARCFDWAVTQGIAELAPNPLRLLPKNYSTYTPADRAAIAVKGMAVKFDTERDRRLNPGEEVKIRSVMNRDKPINRERPLALPYQAAIECIFDLAIETAMRMREIYTIKLDSLDLEQRTVYLRKTKNGKTRQVPLSTVAVEAIKIYMACVDGNLRGMSKFNFDNDCLFPWWDGVRYGETEIEKRYLSSLTATLSSQYARIFDAAGCVDLNFHDLRHEATSRFFERTTLSEFEVMKITGHSSTRMLARYANLRGSNLANKLW